METILLLVVGAVLAFFGFRYFSARGSGGSTDAPSIAPEIKAAEEKLVKQKKDTAKAKENYDEAKKNFKNRFSKYIRWQ